MNFGEAIITCFRKYIIFSGRARRAEFWYWVLFTLIAPIFLALLDTAFFGTSWDGDGPLNIIFALLILIPSFAVAARRLHDINKSGWWQLMPLASMTVLFVLALPLLMPLFILSDMEEAAFGLIGIGFFGFLLIIPMIILIVWWAHIGTNGDNRFGPDPLAEVSIDTA